MRSVRMLVAAVAVVVTAGLAGCGDDKVSTMPDVTGKELDDAKSAIKDAGVDEEVEVDGGGIFGVVVDSNWQVCEQTPAAGAPVDGKPTLTVERSCDDGKDDGEPKPESTPSETASAAPQESASASAEPEAATTLSPQNNKDLAAMLVGDDCADEYAAFATKYQGTTIEFDGSIAAVMDYGNTDAPYDTRYDTQQQTRYNILVAPGDKGSASTKGPSFQFREVEIDDLKFTPKVPKTIGQDDKVHIVAKVGEYDADKCLFFLEPVTTIPR